MAYRNYSMSTVQIRIDFSILIPKFRIKTLNRLDIPKFIYFK